jgi:hypothetical protein
MALDSLVGAECVDPIEVSLDKASEHARWVRRVRRNVQVQVQSLLVQCGMETGSTNADSPSQIHKINTNTSIAKCSAHAMIAVHAGLELYPDSDIDSRIRIRNPDAKNVINESLVEPQVWEAVQESIRMDTIEDGGIRRCRRSAHCSAGQLVPSGITKREHIVQHDDTKCGNECLDGEVLIDELIALQVLGDGT